MWLLGPIEEKRQHYYTHGYDSQKKCQRKKMSFLTPLSNYPKSIGTSKICAKAWSKIEHLRVPKSIIVLRSHYKYIYNHRHTHMSQIKNLSKWVKFNEK